MRVVKVFQLIVLYIIDRNDLIEEKNANLILKALKVVINVFFSMSKAKVYTCVKSYV